MGDSLMIRLATLDDLPTLVQHRRRMFEDIGYSDTAALDAMDAAFVTWLPEHMERGDYRTWLVTTADGEIVAGAALWVMDWPPGPVDASCRRPFVYNVYTHPDYRRRGLARRLMAEVLGWCRERRLKLVALHASDEGSPMYESLGFQHTNEMMLWLGGEPTYPGE